ncbi:ABC transporter permease [Spiroplasma litorale]|uniref:ABC transporter permease n=1 Tax=Spiroplasma litorale TaxID=216942 RepID=A0A0K1W0M1_9MOLU|nr:ABC transporter permease [Spiroplasma litorale]AKX33854.1 ABC transporter permease [Spiroplasma litorale]
MRNISKSYFKLFLKLWVETIGIIVFLTMFTMLVVGMLAIPLQMTIKTNNIKNNTNVWDQQRQNIPAFTNDFIDNYLINYKDENKDIIVENSQNLIKINLPNEGVFSKTAIEKIDEYTEYVKKNDAKTFCEDVSEGEANEDCVNEFTQSARVDFARNLIDSFLFMGNDKTLTIADGSNIEPIKIKEIFTDEGKWLNINGWTTRSLEDYVVHSILNSINNDKINYLTFMNIVYNEPKENTENEYYQYLITSATSLEYDDQRENNIVFSDKNSRLPVANDEVIVNDRYAKLYKKNINDSIYIKNKKFKIVGIGSKYSTISPTRYSQLRSSIENYVQVYVKNSFFYESDDSYTFKKMFATNNYTYSSQTNKMFLFYFENYVNLIDKDYNINDILSSKIKGSEDDWENNSLFYPGVYSFRAFDQHKNINALTNLFIMTYIYLVIGLILFVLGFSFVIFILKKEINNTRNQLGVFKALGYKTSQLTWIFALKNFVSMSFSFIVGYLLSIPFQIDSAEKQFKSTVTIDFDSIYHDYVFLFVLFILVPLLFSLFAYFIIYRVLNVNALSLIQQQTRRNKKNYLLITLQIIFFPTLIFTLINYIILSSSKKYNKNFNFRLQSAFVSDNKGKFALIVSLFGISAFLFTMELRATPVLKNMFESGYNIYSKNVNHFYQYNSINNVKYTDKGLMRNNVKPDYKISYDDVSNGLENYISENINYSNKISTLINKVSDFRNDAIKNSNEIYKKYSWLISNFAFLMYPLDTDEDKIDIKSWIDETILELLKDPSVENVKNIIDNKIMNKKNVLSIKPIENSKNTGIYTNDIAKYVCVSLPNYTEDCNDLSKFKDLAKKTGGDFGNKDPNLGEQSKVAISSVLKEWLTTFAVSDDINPFIAANKVLYDKNEESLSFTIPFYVDGNPDVDSSDSKLVLIDTTNKYGDARNIFNFSSISDNSYNSLKEVNDNYFNGLISYRLSKILGVNTGDSFEVNLANTKYKKVIKVAGVISDNTLMQEIYLDHDTVMKKISTNVNKEQVYFNNLYSTKVASEGQIDLTDIKKSIDTFRNKREIFAFATTNSKPWLSANLDLFISNFSNLAPPGAIKNIADHLKEYVISAYDQKYFINPGVITLPILKQLINSIIGEVQKALLTYIIIDIFLLTVLLIVLMNVIINDAINIITVMRSMGYSNKKINWIIMGKYIIFSFISFLIGYSMSLLTWKIIQIVIWSQYKVLVSTPTIIWLPFVSAIVLGTILYIGWFAAKMQIRKKPLTLLVS